MEPWDLDLHTMLPAEKGHVYYSRTNPPGDDLQSPGWLDHDHLSGPSPSVGERLLVTESPKSLDPTARQYCFAVAFFTAGENSAGEFTLFVDYQNRTRYQCTSRVSGAGKLDQETAFRDLCRAGIDGSAARFSPPLFVTLPTPGEPFAAPAATPGWHCEPL